MKKLIFAFFIFLFTTLAHAGGGMTHMFLAEETIALLPDAQLRQLLLANKEAYLVGAYYPDSGYVKGSHYGEDSHWDPFINAFATYLKTTYQHPASDNPKLVAFLFGCAAHRVSDEIIHWTFYKVMKDEDFNGDYDKAHTYGDIGIDLLLNIDKAQWLTHPKTWWVPVNDLLQVYHLMGKDSYTADEIIHGNKVIAVAGYGERTISLPSYHYLQKTMPWTAANYYTYPKGGMQMDENKIASYQMRLWQKLQDDSIIDSASPLPHHTSHLSLSEQTATSLVDEQSINLDVTHNRDGSVEIKQPEVKDAAKWEQHLLALRKALGLL